MDDAKSKKMCRLHHHLVPSWRAIHIYLSFEAIALGELRSREMGSG